MYFKYIYLLLLLEKTTSLSELYFATNLTNSEEAKLKRDLEYVEVKDAIDTHIVVQSEGIFRHFIMELLNVLTSRYPARMLKHYVKVLGKELDQLEYRISKKLAKYLKSLAKEPRDVVRSELQELRKDFIRDDNLPRRKEFLKAINHVYTLRENTMFRNYILEVKDYGEQLIPFIHEETNKIIVDAIINPILKMSNRDQQDLEKKLKAAYREYTQKGRFRFT